MNDSSDSSTNGSFEGEIEKIDNMDANEVFKILVTTDNHLGYLEKDPERNKN